MRILFFDTETTGLPKDKYTCATFSKNNWPDVVSISWQLFYYDELKRKETFIIKPDGWTISEEVSKIHGITQKHAETEGVSLEHALSLFKIDLSYCDMVVAHNIEFDRNVLLNAYKWRLGLQTKFWPYEHEFCTAQNSKGDLKLPSRQKIPNPKDPYKLPRLDELYEATFHEPAPKMAHTSERDVDVLQKIFWKRWDVSEVHMNKKLQL